jgi:hypothetical protein
MSTNEEPMSAFERRAREVLLESVTRIDARTRSRLNQARHAAVERAQPRRAGWLKLGLMPATGAVAVAVLVALVMINQAPKRGATVTEGAQPTLEVLDLLADEEGLNLMEDEDHGFYEWAAAEGDAAAQGGADTSG